MAWILDVIFFVVLLIGCIIGGKIGFIKGVCKVAGWILSFVIPFVCCMAFKDALENWFGLMTLIQEGVKNATLAEWITIAISFVGLFIIVRLGTFLLGLIGGALANAVTPVKVVNTLLGSILGMVEAFLILYFLLLLCGWFNIVPAIEFIEQSWVVGAIFKSDLIAYLHF